MKKLLVLFLLVYVVSIATAQDTVRHSDTWYAYTNKGVLTEVIDSQQNIFFCNSNNQAIDTQYHALVYQIPNKHAWLYGIAITVYDTIRPMDIATDYTTIALRAYHGVTLTPTGFGNAWWNANQEELLKANRNNVKECMFEYNYDYPSANTVLAHCYEFYFDQPVPIATEDTLYIGLVSFGFWELVCGISSVAQNIINLYYNPTNPLCDIIPPSSPLLGHLWGGIFPIVELRCTAPRGLRLCDTGIPTACWSGDTNAEMYQVSVCSGLVEPELGTLATVYDTSYDLSQLHPDSAYMVYLRKRCGFISDTVWSDWSGPLVIGDTTGWAGSTGIDEAGAAAITLTPNPAAERVTVAAEGMESAELIGVDGVVLQRRECRDACTLDLRGLAAGVYMVRVGTAQGTATKRLVVQ